MDILRKAKSNREKFLKPYHEKFESAKTEKAKATIIAKLLSFEPSHLREPWVIRKVEFWLRDYFEYQDFIETVFIKTPKKRARTDKQYSDSVRLDILKMDVEKYTAEGHTVNKSIALILESVPEGEKYLRKWKVPKFDNIDIYKGSEVIDLIRKYYEKAKKLEAQRGKFMPWPYYGRDVDTDEQSKIVISGGR